MDIYNFIDSKDIRAHLQSLRYDFTLPESAFLVWQCANATLDERHKAWRELIREIPDCGMETRRNMSAIKSMHGFLHSYMVLEQKLLREFYQETDSVYFYNILEKDRHVPGGFSQTEEFERAFPNLPCCLASVKEEINVRDEMDILRIEIRKQRLSVPGHILTICVNSKLEVRCCNCTKKVKTDTAPSSNFF